MDERQSTTLRARIDALPLDEAKCELERLNRSIYRNEMCNNTYAISGEMRGDSHYRTLLRNRIKQLGGKSSAAYGLEET